jgi:hypothetical protein
MLELLILTGMRSETVRWAQVDEFDLVAAVWTIPQRRMKALDRDQRIPLGSRAVELVRELAATPTAICCSRTRAALGQSARTRLASYCRGY